MPSKASKEHEAIEGASAPEGHGQLDDAGLRGIAASVDSSNSADAIVLTTNTNPIARQTVFLGDSGGNFDDFMGEIPSIAGFIASKIDQIVDSDRLSMYKHDREPEKTKDHETYFLRYRDLKNKKEKNEIIDSLQALDTSDLTEIFREAQALLKARAASETSYYMEADLVTEEIRNEVTVKWADRKNLENRGQPWTKGPVAFISHWYGKWLKAGTLVRAHLRHDEPLYVAYTGYLRRCLGQGVKPEIELSTEDRVYIDDPATALQRKREQNAASARRRIRHQKNNSS